MVWLSLMAKLSELNEVATLVMVTNTPSLSSDIISPVLLTSCTLKLVVCDRLRGFTTCDMVMFVVTNPVDPTTPVLVRPNVAKWVELEVSMMQLAALSWVLLMKHNEPEFKCT